jgi:hypothetical protein
MQRRERTRHLIELGGLVQKVGLVDLTDDDRATLLGGLLGLADMLQGEGGEVLREVWRRRGKAAFELDAALPQGAGQSTAREDQFSAAFGEQRP